MSPSCSAFVALSTSASLSPRPRPIFWAQPNEATCSSVVTCSSTYPTSSGSLTLTRRVHCSLAMPGEQHRFSLLPLGSLPRETQYLTVQQNMYSPTSKKTKVELLHVILLDEQWHSTKELVRKVGHTFGGAIFKLRSYGYRVVRERQPGSRRQHRYRLVDEA